MPTRRSPPSGRARKDGLSAAARVWLARNPSYVGHTIRFDIVMVVPRRWPAHLANAFAATD